jgi:hypothetical protein
MYLPLTYFLGLLVPEQYFHQGGVGVPDHADGVGQPGIGRTHRAGRVDVEFGHAG